MAGTYFGYAERQADSQVNWFQVGKDLTDMLREENKLREKKKAAIDEASRQFGQELENAPQGNSDDVNQWTTNYASDMQQYRLMTDRLLKSGQLKEKDYMLIRQNTMDGTKNLFNLSKEYQAEFDAKTRRRMEDKSSASETQFMAMVEGFANLGQTKALINPTTGAISVGKMVSGPNGVRQLAEGPDSYMTVNQLRQRIKQNIDKYQLNEALEAESKLLGTVVQEMVTKTGSSTQTGFITKITDPTQRKGLKQEGQQTVDAYIEVEKKIIEAQLSNPQHVSSVLFDWAKGIDPKTNKPYQVTLDKNLAESSSHYVLWGYKDGVFQPDFESTANGKEQYKTAEDYVRLKFRSTLEQKTEVQPFSQPRKEYAPAYVYERGDKKGAEKTAGNLIAKLYSGTPAEQQSAVNYFTGLPNVRSVSRNDDGVTVTLSDGTTKTISFINEQTKERMSQDDFVRSSSSLLLGGNVDVNEVLKGSLSTGTKDFQSGSASGSAQLNNPNQMYANYISSNITTVPKDEEDAVKQLAPIISKLGFSVREAKAGQDYIIIKNNKGVESEAIDLTDSGAAESIKGFLLGNVPGADETEKAMYINNLAEKGALKGSGQSKQGVGAKYNQ
jgi:hypothetical protein